MKMCPIVKKIKPWHLHTFKSFTIVLISETIIQTERVTKCYVKPIHLSDERNRHAAGGKQTEVVCVPQRD